MRHSSVWTKPLAMFLSWVFGFGQAMPVAAAHDLVRGLAADRAIPRDLASRSTLGQLHARLTTEQISRVIEELQHGEHPDQVFAEGVDLGSLGRFYDDGVLPESVQQAIQANVQSGVIERGLAQLGAEGKIAANVRVRLDGLRVAIDVTHIGLDQHPEVSRALVDLLWDLLPEEAQRHIAARVSAPPIGGASDALRLLIVEQDLDALPPQLREPSEATVVHGTNEALEMLQAARRRGEMFGALVVMVHGAGAHGAGTTINVAQLIDRVRAHDLLMPVIIVHNEALRQQDLVRPEQLSAVKFVSSPGELSRLSRTLWPYQASRQVLMIDEVPEMLEATVSALNGRAKGATNAEEAIQVLAQARERGIVMAAAVMTLHGSAAHGAGTGLDTADLINQLSFVEPWLPIIVVRDPTAPRPSLRLGGAHAITMVEGPATAEALARLLAPQFFVSSPPTLAGSSDVPLSSAVQWHHISQLIKQLRRAIAAHQIPLQGISFRFSHTKPKDAPVISYQPETGRVEIIRYADTKPSHAIRTLLSMYEIPRPVRDRVAMWAKPRSSELLVVRVMDPHVSLPELQELMGPEGIAVHQTLAFKVAVVEALDGALLRDRAQQAGLMEVPPPSGSALAFQRPVPISGAADAVLSPQMKQLLKEVRVAIAQPGWKRFVEMTPTGQSGRGGQVTVNFVPAGHETKSSRGPFKNPLEGIQIEVDQDATLSRLLAAVHENGSIPPDFMKAFDEVAAKIGLLAGASDLTAGQQPAEVMPEVFMQSDGTGVAPALALMEKVGALERFTNDRREFSARELEDGIVQRLRAEGRMPNANNGFIHEAMRSFEAVGWVQRTGHTDDADGMRFIATEAGLNAFRLAPKFIEAFEALPILGWLDAYMLNRPRDPPAEAALVAYRDLIAFALSGFRDSIHASTRHIEQYYLGQLLLHTLVALKDIETTLPDPKHPGQFLPLMDELARRGRVDLSTIGSELNLPLNEAWLTEAFKLLAHPRLGWVTVTTSGEGHMIVTLTPAGIEAVRLGWTPGVFVSYAPTNSKLVDLLETVGTPERPLFDTLFPRVNGAETHVRRARNSKSTGANHPRYYRDILGRLVPKFDTDDLDSQPRLHIDVGTSNALLPTMLFGEMLKTKRGAALRANPRDPRNQFVVVLSDLNKEALDVAEKNLTAEEFEVDGQVYKVQPHQYIRVIADIKDPVEFDRRVRAAMREHLVQFKEYFGDPEAKLFDGGTRGWSDIGLADGLVTATFLIHNRPWIDVKDQAAIPRWKPITGHIDHETFIHPVTGRLIPVIEHDQQLYEFARLWAPYLKHGFVTVELSSVDPKILAVNQGSINGLGNDAPHFRSSQFPRDIRAVKLVLKQAGYDVDVIAQYPAKRPDGTLRPDSEVNVSVVEFKPSLSAVEGPVASTGTRDVPLTLPKSAKGEMSTAEQFAMLKRIVVYIGGLFKKRFPEAGPVTVTITETGTSAQVTLENPDKGWVEGIEVSKARPVIRISAKVKAGDERLLDGHLGALTYELELAAQEVPLVTTQPVAAPALQADPAKPMGGASDAPYGTSDADQPPQTERDLARLVSLAWRLPQAYDTIQEVLQHRGQGHSPPADILHSLRRLIAQGQAHGLELAYDDSLALQELGILPAMSGASDANPAEALVPLSHGSDFVTTAAILFDQADIGPAIIPSYGNPLHVFKLNSGTPAWRAFLTFMVEEFERVQGSSKEEQRAVHTLIAHLRGKLAQGGAWRDDSRADDAALSSLFSGNQWQIADALSPRPDGIARTLVIGPQRHEPVIGLVRTRSVNEEAARVQDGWLVLDLRSGELELDFTPWPSESDSKGVGGASDAPGNVPVEMRVSFQVPRGESMTLSRALQELVPAAYTSASQKGRLIREGMRLTVTALTENGDAREEGKARQVSGLSRRELFNTEPSLLNAVLDPGSDIQIAIAVDRDALRAASALAAAQRFHQLFGVPQDTALQWLQTGEEAQRFYAGTMTPQEYVEHLRSHVVSVADWALGPMQTAAGQEFQALSQPQQLDSIGRILYEAHDAFARGNSAAPGGQAFAGGSDAEDSGFATFGLAGTSLGRDSHAVIMLRTRIAERFKDPAQKQHVEDLLARIARRENDHEPEVQHAIIALTTPTMHGLSNGLVKEWMRLTRPAGGASLSGASGADFLEDAAYQGYFSNEPHATFRSSKALILDWDRVPPLRRERDLARAVSNAWRLDRAYDTVEEVWRNRGKGTEPPAAMKQRLARLYETARRRLPRLDQSKLADLGVLNPVAEMAGASDAATGGSTAGWSSGDSTPRPAPDLLKFLWAFGDRYTELNWAAQQNKAEAVPRFDIWTGSGIARIALYSISDAPLENELNALVALATQAGVNAIKGSDDAGRPLIVFEVQLDLLHRMEQVVSKERREELGFSPAYERLMPDARATIDAISEDDQVREVLTRVYLGELAPILAMERLTELLQGTPGFTEALTQDVLRQAMRLPLQRPRVTGSSDGPLPAAGVGDLGPGGSLPAWLRAEFLELISPGMARVVQDAAPELAAVWEAVAQRWHDPMIDWRSEADLTPLLQKAQTTYRNQPVPLEVVQALLVLSNPGQMVRRIVLNEVRPTLATHLAHPSLNLRAYLTLEAIHHSLGNQEARRLRAYLAGLGDAWAPLVAASLEHSIKPDSEGTGNRVIDWPLAGGSDALSTARELEAQADSLESPRVAAPGRDGADGLSDPNAAAPGHDPFEASPEDRAVAGFGASDAPREAAQPVLPPLTEAKQRFLERFSAIAAELVKREPDGASMTFKPDQQPHEGGQVRLQGPLDGSWDAALDSLLKTRPLFDMPGWVEDMSGRRWGTDDRFQGPRLYVMDTSQPLYVRLQEEVERLQSASGARIIAGASDTNGMPPAPRDIQVTAVNTIRDALQQAGVSGEDFTRITIGTLVMSVKVPSIPEGDLLPIPAERVTLDFGVVPGSIITLTPAPRGSSGPRIAGASDALLLPQSGAAATPPSWSELTKQAARLGQGANQGRIIERFGRDTDSWGEMEFLRTWTRLFSRPGPASFQQHVERVQPVMSVRPALPNSFFAKGLEMAMQTLYRETTSPESKRAIGEVLAQRANHTVTFLVVEAGVLGQDMARYPKIPGGGAGIAIDAQFYLETIGAEMRGQRVTIDQYRRFTQRLLAALTPQEGPASHSPHARLQSLFAQGRDIQASGGMVLLLLNGADDDWRVYFIKPLIEDELYEPDELAVLKWGDRPLVTTIESLPLWVFEAWRRASGFAEVSLVKAFQAHGVQPRLVVIGKPDSEHVVLSITHEVSRDDVFDLASQLLPPRILERWSDGWWRATTRFAVTFSRDNQPSAPIMLAPGQILDLEGWNLPATLVEGDVLTITPVAVAGASEADSAYARLPEEARNALEAGLLHHMPSGKQALRTEARRLLAEAVLALTPTSDSLEEATTARLQAIGFTSEEAGALVGPLRRFLPKGQRSKDGRIAGTSDTNGLPPVPRDIQVTAVSTIKDALQQAGVSDEDFTRITTGTLVLSVKVPSIPEGKLLPVPAEHVTLDFGVVPGSIITLTPAPRGSSGPRIAGASAAPLEGSGNAARKPQRKEPRELTWHGLMRDAITLFKDRRLAVDVSLHPERGSRLSMTYEPPSSKPGTLRITFDSTAITLADVVRAVSAEKEIPDEVKGVFRQIAATYGIVLPIAGASDAAASAGGSGQLPGRRMKRPPTLTASVFQAELRRRLPEMRVQMEAGTQTSATYTPGFGHEPAKLMVRGSPSDIVLTVLADPQMPRHVMQAFQIIAKDYGITIAGASDAKFDDYAGARWIPGDTSDDSMKPANTPWEEILGPAVAPAPVPSMPYMDKLNALGLPQTRALILGLLADPKFKNDPKIQGLFGTQVTPEMVVAAFDVANPRAVLIHEATFEEEDGVLRHVKRSQIETQLQIVVRAVAERRLPAESLAELEWFTAHPTGALTFVTVPQDGNIDAVISQLNEDIQLADVSFVGPETWVLDPKRRFQPAFEREIGLFALRPGSSGSTIAAALEVAVAGGRVTEPVKAKYDVRQEGEVWTTQSLTASSAITEILRANRDVLLQV